MIARKEATKRFRVTIATAVFFALAVLAVNPAPAQDFEPDHRLVLYISDSDPAKMQSVLSVATNVTKHYSQRGELVDIRIIAFNEGLHMLRQDTSPVMPRLKSFQTGVPNVEFFACGNTLDTMERDEGQRPAIFSEAAMVQTGVAELMRLAEEGWILVRP
jgi:intracellular sulfur oxidation DsrE/DsrF family protein